MTATMIHAPAGRYSRSCQTGRTAIAGRASSASASQRPRDWVRTVRRADERSAGSSPSSDPRRRVR